MTKIKGSEVDESAERFLKSTNVEKNAVLAWELDDEQYGRMEVMNLDGYCPLAIETEPLFRIDEEDKKARSSNYQASYFALDGGMILTYTAVKSLVDAEYTDSSHIWRIASITDVRIEKLVRRCALTPGRESEKADGDFNALTIRGENGEYFVYSFREEQREDAELLCKTILKRMDRNARLRKPVRKGAGRIVLEDAGPLTKKQIAAWNVGVIGDEMDDL